MALHELVYMSEAKQEMSPAELMALLEKARKKNTQMKITGLLVYYQGKFAQMLEGSKADIFALYETICRDERHHEILLVWDASIEHRALADWSMAFVTPESDLKKELGYSPFLETGEIKEDRKRPPSWARLFMLTLRDKFLK